MRKAHWILMILLTYSVTHAHAAAVGNSNLGLTDQSDIPNEDGILMEKNESCGITYKAPEQSLNADHIGYQDPSSINGQHGYENNHYRCNEHFAQFSMLTIK